MTGRIVSVAKRAEHRLDKQTCERIRLVAGLGVEGDAHCGETVQHLSRLAKTPDAPNLRQVHLIHAELFTELAGKAFDIEPGQMGENITTSGIDLLGLAPGTRLRLGSNAIIEITGLRNPCRQLEGLATGLMAAVLEKAPDGSLIRKAGVMGVVVAGGGIRVGDSIQIDFTPVEHAALQPV